MINQPPPPSLSRRLFLGGSVAAAAVIGGAGNLVLATAAAAAPETTATINPIVRQRADPWLIKHSDGRYYFTGSVPEYDRIVLRSSSTIAGLEDATETIVWTRPSSGVMGGHIWAPELHHFDGQWHIYFAAGNSDSVFAVRIYVISNSSADPLTGTWSVPARVFTHEDSFSLDATTFEHNGQRYLVWAQTEAGVNSSLFIASMSGPSTLSSAVTRIATPSYEWETRGYRVNEGAAVIRRNGRIFISYSASATDANYCMGLLTADENADLLNAASWTKSPTPVFTTNEGTKQYGPGHNSFSRDEEGNDILVYHARSYRNIVGDPLYDPNRHARVQRLYWNADGTPNFGVPVGDGELPVRLRPASAADQFIVHDGLNLTVSAYANSTTELPASQFRVAPGYGKKGSVVIEPILTKGRYLRVEGDKVVVAATPNSSSAFNRRRGLSDSSGWSFESVDFPGSFLRVVGGVLGLSKVDSAQKASATFYPEG
jgi:GH43 family beta-xylosidase